jgi:hypothetical protein
MAEVAEHELMENVCYLKSYIKDTTEFLQKLNKIPQPLPGINGFLRFCNAFSHTILVSFLGTLGYNALTSKQNIIEFPGNGCGILFYFCSNSVVSFM